MTIPRRKSQTEDLDKCSFFLYLVMPLPCLVMVLGELLGTLKWARSVDLDFKVVDTMIERSKENRGVLKERGILSFSAATLIWSKRHRAGPNQPTPTEPWTLF